MGMSRLARQLPGGIGPSAKVTLLFTGCACEVAGWSEATNQDTRRVYRLCIGADFGFWPISEVARLLIEVRLARHSGRDLLMPSSSQYDPLCDISGAVELPPFEPHSATFSVLINSLRYSIPKWEAQMRSNIVTLAAATIVTAASTVRPSRVDWPRSGKH
jgi:hypothetical protein